MNSNEYPRTIFQQSEEQSATNFIALKKMREKKIKYRITYVIAKPFCPGLTAYTHKNN